MTDERERMKVSHEFSGLHIGGAAQQGAVRVTGTVPGEPVVVEVEWTHVTHAPGGSSVMPLRAAVSVPWEAWVIGLRCLAIVDVVPIAAIALADCLAGELAPEVPGGLRHADPGTVASRWADSAVAEMKNRKPGAELAPEGHAFFEVLEDEVRRQSGQGFYLGWFSGRDAHGKR